MIPTSGENSVVLLNGIVIDGTGADPLRDAVVVIRNGRLAMVGPRSKVQVPADAKVFDVQGATMLPGFINTHVHYGRFSNLRNWQSLRTWAIAGVTTVRDMNAPEPLSVNAVRNELLKDNKNARLILSTPIMTVPNGYPMARTGIPNNPFGVVTSKDDAISKVSQYLDYGADLVKVAVDSNERANHWPTLALDQVSAIVQLAHRRGFKVSSHTTTQRDLPTLLDANIDEIAHMATVPVSDVLIEQIVKAKMVWVPTLELWKAYGDVYDRAKVNLTNFVAAGGMVALGTDYNGDSRADWQGGMPMIEIQGMREAGMTPMQIIVSATRNAALACNLDHELGTLEAGKVADVLVVNGNPLQDLNVLANVCIVIHNGAVIREPGGS